MAEIERQLECPICLERFVEPSLFPCQHTVCRAHISSLEDRGMVRCPECRSEHMVPVGGFPTNITIQRLLSAPIPPNVPVPPPVQPQDTRPVTRQSSIYYIIEVPQTEEPSQSRLAGRLCGFFKKARENLRKVLNTFLTDYQTLMRITILVMLVITVSRFIAGAVKLSSDCPKERQAAVYLFVKSLFGFMFWSVLAVLGFKQQLIRALHNPFVEVCIVLEASFSLIWFLIGQHWVFGNFGDMRAECPLYIISWNQSFINFAIFLTVIDWIGLFAFFFYAGYTIWDDNTVHSIN